MVVSFIFLPLLWYPPDVNTRTEILALSYPEGGGHGFRHARTRGLPRGQSNRAVLGMPRRHSLTDLTCEYDESTVGGRALGWRSVDSMSLAIVKDIAGDCIHADSIARDGAVCVVERRGEPFSGEPTSETSEQGERHETTWFTTGANSLRSDQSVR
jgi:hypothetical protein